MTMEIHHKPEQDRFEAEVDGNLCLLEYTLRDRIISMNSVRVPPPVEGRGIAGRLTRTALDHARSQGWQVIPRCPYVAAWIKRHPEYQDLVGHRTPD